MKTTKPKLAVRPPDMRPGEFWVRRIVDGQLSPYDSDAVEILGAPTSRKAATEAASYFGGGVAHEGSTEDVLVEDHLGNVLAFRVTDRVVIHYDIDPLPWPPPAPAGGAASVTDRAPEPNPLPREVERG